MTSITSSGTLLVVPTYNEAARLDRAAYCRFVESEADVSILFVDDGSADRTAEVLAELKARNHRIDVLPLAQNQGKAEAVRLGVLHAFKRNPEFIGYWDADLATPLDAVIALRQELIRNSAAELVMGARVRLLGRNIQRKALRHYLGRIFSTAASVVLKLPVYDTQCGAKLFRASPMMKACFEKPFMSRWIFDVELLARLTATPSGTRGEMATEFPLVNWRDIGGSRLRARDFVRAPIELLAIYRGRPPAHAPKDPVERPSTGGAASKP